jgi:hypothetical protein
VRLRKLCRTAGLVLLALLAAPTALGSQDNHSGKAQTAYFARIAYLYSLSGRVTTLGCYDPTPTRQHPIQPGKPDPFPPCPSSDYDRDGVVGAHPGSYPIDIGQVSVDTTVWIQNAFLPNQVRGGYVYGQLVSGYCQNLTGTQDNGRRVRAWIYYYDAYDYADVNATVFQHIKADQIPLEAWVKWNNHYATNPLWPSWMSPWSMNNGGSGGVPIGRVSAIGSSTPASCATAAHVHQEVEASGRSPDWDRAKWADGCYNQAPGSGEGPCPWNPFGGVNWKWVPGTTVGGRNHVAHYLDLNVRN